MKKNLKSIILGCLFVCMSIVIIFSLCTNHNFLPKTNVWNNNTHKTENVSNSSKTKDAQKKDQMKQVTVRKKNTFDMGSEVSTEGMTYKINSVSRTKKGNHYLDNSDCPYPKIDSSGNIINEYSYVIVNVTICNTIKSNKEFYLNKCTLENGVSQMGVEPRSFDKGKDISRKDYFCYIFQPSEKSTFNIAYVVKDEDLDTKKIDFIIDPNGIRPFTDNVRIIQIRKFENKN